MRKLIIILLFLIGLLSACNATPGAPPAGNTLVLPLTSGTAITTEGYIEVRDGELWLRVLSPQNGAVVSAEIVDVSGQAPPGVIVTVNGHEVLVPPDQFFRRSIPLVTGSNRITISARNDAGARLEVSLFITRQP